MFETISPLAIFSGIVLWSIFIYVIGFIQGENEANRKFIAEVVKRVGTEDPEHLVQLVEEAAEKKNLLESEQKRLIKTILKEAKKQRDKG